tara:strand:+ start:208 stop:324 length:117 start_codon:yes stop_codon:yes gene_type:complete
MRKPLKKEASSNLFEKKLISKQEGTKELETMTNHEEGI